MIPAPKPPPKAPPRAAPEVDVLIKSKLWRKLFGAETGPSDLHAGIEPYGGRPTSPLAGEVAAKRRVRGRAVSTGAGKEPPHPNPLPQGERGSGQPARLTAVIPLRAEAIVREAIVAAADLCDAVPFDCELTIVLTDDAAIRDLNKQWRGIDKPTNVLSFPTPDREGADEVPGHLGDIVIAAETLAREAEEERKSPLAHLSHLVVHGFLHLLGYDHRDDDEAEVMERLEARILAELGLSDPYAAPARVRAITR